MVGWLYEVRMLRRVVLVRCERKVWYELRMGGKRAYGGGGVEYVCEKEMR